ncbi:hypothetical protein MRS44_004561 [Fusarium solani]|uniref:uncharacterized protein n=1 Tax=Fusarium solani TaxID=169388 RepID=UPI0032C3D83A|nr:hypothetical protein MRS44_004561 [Fusarium solani]
MVPGALPSYWGQELQAGERGTREDSKSRRHFCMEWFYSTGNGSFWALLCCMSSLRKHTPLDIQGRNASNRPQEGVGIDIGVAGRSTPTDINADVQDRHPSRNVAQRREGGTGARAARWALCLLGLQVSSGTLARVLAENLGLHPRIHASTAWVASDLNALGHPGTEFVVLLP